MPMGQLAGSAQRRSRHCHDHGEGAAESGLAEYEPYNGVRLTRPDRDSPRSSCGAIG